MYYGLNEWLILHSMSEADAIPEIMADSDTCLSAANTDIIAILGTIFLSKND